MANHPVLGHVFVVVRRDPYLLLEISVHETEVGAHRAVEEFKSRYGDAGEISDKIKWHERDYGRAHGWIRYVESFFYDGPDVRIERKELRE